MSFAKTQDCIICMEPLTNGLVSTPCGHVYHENCIKKWIPQRKSCPQCKQTCDPSSLIKLYLSFDPLNIDDQNGESISMEKLSAVEISNLETKLEKYKTRLKRYTNETSILQEKVSAYNKEIKELRGNNTNLTKGARHVKLENKRMSILNKELERKVESLMDANMAISFAEDPNLKKLLLNFQYNQQDMSSSKWNKLVKVLEKSNLVNGEKRKKLNKKLVQVQAQLEKREIEVTNLRKELLRKENHKERTSKFDRQPLVHTMRDSIPKRKLTPSFLQHTVNTNRPAKVPKVLKRGGMWKKENSFASSHINKPVTSIVSSKDNGRKIKTGNDVFGRRVDMFGARQSNY